MPEKSPSEVIAVKEPKPPAELVEDILDSRSRKQAGVGLAERHHIASKYDKNSKAMFEKAGMSIDNELNKINDFAEHGQLRGWVEWRKGYFDKSGKWIKPKYKHHLKGHHSEYKSWVNKLLWEGTPPNLTSEHARKRITEVLKKLGPIIRKNPDVLTHGPRISSNLARLKFEWK